MTDLRWCLACGASVDAATGGEACPTCGQRLIPRAAFRRTGLDSLTPHTPPALRPPDVDEAAARAESRFDRFILVEEIGEGGAGTVYRAWDGDQNRFVALKILRDVSSTTEARFAREAYAATRLAHPNIIKVHHHGVFQGRPFIAMELVRGRTLASALAGGMPIDARMALFQTVCDAIHHAHVNGIVHRDIKPANILIDTEGHPIVVDFGLSRPREQGWTLTMKEQAVGTPQYMSPEQTRGGEAASRPATDVYSLGAVLYHLLCGRPPFSGESAFEIMGRVAGEPPVPPRRLEPAVPLDLETISLKCLEKEPERRYASAAELAVEIGRWRRGEPIVARPLPTAARLWRLLARRRAVAIPTAIAIAALVAATLFYRSEGQAGAQREAFALIEAARPAFDEASLLLYSPACSAAGLEVILAKARPTLRRAVERCPSLPHAHFALGRSWSMAGRDDLAEPAFRRAAELDPRFAPALFELGRLALDRSFLATLWGNPADRASKMSTAARFAEEASSKLGAALDAGFAADDPLQRDVASAMLAYTRNDPPGALAIAAKALGSTDGRPGSEELCLLQAVIGPEAEARLQRAVAIRPAFAKARLCLGAFRHHQGRFTDAILEYDRAIASAPRVAAAWSNRGIARHHLGDASGADADHTAAIGLDAGYALAWVNRGAARADLGRDREAMADYAEAIRLEATLHQAFAGRSAMYRRARDTAAALKDLDEAIRLNDAGPEYRFLRGDLRRELDDRAGATSDLRRALDLAPRSWPRRMATTELLRGLETPRDH